MNRALVFLLLIPVVMVTQAQNNLTAPENLRVEIINDGDDEVFDDDDVLINWEFTSPPPENFNGFALFRNGVQIAFNNSVNDTSHTDSDLPSDSTYIYKVCAVYNSFSDTSNFSNRGIITIRENYYFQMGSGNAVTGNTWSVYFDSAMVNNAPVSPGDEMAVFDGDTVVGHAIFHQQPLPGNNPPEVVIAFAKITTDSTYTGYTPGNPYSFKLYDASRNQLYENYDTTLIQVDSNAYMEGVFPYPDDLFSMVYIEFLPQWTSPEIQEITNEDHTVTLSWIHNSSQRNFIGYNVFRNGVQQNNQPIPGMAYTDDSVPSEEHYYYVDAVYDENNSVSSDSAYISIGTIFYDPVTNGDNPLDPMEITIEEATLMEQPLQLFDEIGVFKYMNNDTICIAAKSLTEELTENAEEIISVPTDTSDNPINGFEAGDTLHFHFYDYQADMEYERVMVSASAEGESEVLTFVPNTDTNIYLQWLPYEPVNLSADSVVNYDAYLSWNENPANDTLSLSGYNIYRNQNKINPDIITSPSYPDDSLYVDDYVYRVEAVYEEATSRKSDSLNVTIPMQKFIPVSEDTSSGTMDFYIAEATIDGQNLEAFDEIGVFAPSDNGEICVGSNSLTNQVNSDNPLHIRAYQHDSSISDTKNGYLPGDTISYRFWKEDDDQVFSIIAHSFPHPPEQNHNFEVFSSGDTCFVNLSFTSPPPVQFSYQTQSYCEQSVGHIHTTVSDFNNVSGFSLHMVLDSDYYQYDTIVAEPDFINELDVSLEADTLSVDWTSNEQFSLPDGSNLLHLTIQTTAPGQTNIGWLDNTSEVSGMENLGATFTDSDFFIDYLPETPENINGDDDVCQNTDSSIYTVSNAPYANDYVWGLAPNQAGTVVANGQTATIYWNESFSGTNVTLSAAGINDCGEGGAVSKNIEIKDVVVVDVSINSQPQEPCENDTIIFTADAENGGNYPSYTWFVNDVEQNEDSDTFTMTDFQDEDKVYCLFTSSQPCAENNPATSNTIVLDIDFLPETPNQILGNTLMCNTVGSSEYTTPGSAYSESYEWVISHPNAKDTIICLNSSCQDITINWNTDWEGVAFLWVRGVNDCGSGFYIDTPLNITRNYCTSTPQTTQAQWHFYPNPVENRLTIESISGDKLQWQLLRASGQVLESGRLTGKEASIDVEALSRGIYFLKVRTNRGSVVKKVIKK